MARWDKVIYLVSSKEDKNEIGDVISSEESQIKVYANKKSIRQSEFYQAMANGIKPELMFEIQVFEYGNQSELLYEGEKYSIIRTFNNGNDRIELVCQGVDFDGPTQSE